MEEKKLNLKELLEFVRGWEIENGESFMDYAGNDLIFMNISFLLGYWSVAFPELYNFLMKENNGGFPWKYAQDNLTDLVEHFYGNSPWKEETYRASLLPWLSLIVFNDIYYKRFSNWKDDRDD